MYTYPPTQEVTAKQLAAQRAAARREKALASLAHNTVGERKASGGDYGGGMGRWVKVTVLASSSRGRNARGTTGAKRGWGGSQPKGAKRAKRQNPQRMGMRPRVSATNWSQV